VRAAFRHSVCLANVRTQGAKLDSRGLIVFNGRVPFAWVAQPPLIKAYNPAGITRSVRDG